MKTSQKLFLFILMVLFSTYSLVASITIGANDQDLSNDGWLRFSPESTDVESLNNEPDVLTLHLTLENWQVPGDIASFKIRVDQEGTRNYIGYLEYDNTNVTDDGFGNLTIDWDGKLNGNYLAEGTYGLTLWSVADGGGELIFDHNLNDNTILSDGATLNRIHSIIDNSAPAYEPNLTTTETILNRYIFDTNDNDTADTGEAITIADNSSFSFGVTREFITNTDPLRHETVNYWLVVEESATPANIHYFKENGSTQGYVAQQIEAVFSQPFTSTELVGEAGSEITWNLDFANSFDTYPAGVYNIYAYIQDNAGNIAKSDIKTITITDNFYTPPAGNNIEIISQHFSTLPAFDSGGDHNFYLNTSYYTTQGTIDIRFTVENPANISKMVVDASILDLGEIEVLGTAFDAVTKQYTMQWNVADFAEILAGSYQIGDNYNIPVTLYDLFDFPVAFAWVDEFNLVIPDVPDWPDVNDLNLSVDKSVISPGNPLWSYNADTNPANDDELALDNATGDFDSNTISYDITSSIDSDCDWVLTVTNGIKTIIKNGTVLQGNNTTSDVLNFYGYDDSFEQFYGSEDSGEIDITLAVTPTGLTDTGYETPSNLEKTDFFTVDNINPVIVGKDGNGFIDDVDPLLIPVVTENDNEFTINVTASEELSDVIDNTNDNINVGWSALVVDKENGSTLNFNGSDVTAVITDITTTDNLTFDITVQITNLEGDYPIDDANLDAVLIIRTPNDAAANPGRYNDPVYPLLADVFWQDACEAYTTFRIHNSKPVIDYVQFTNYNSISIATYEGDVWNNASLQGYVNDDTLTIAAIVSGGAYGRSITSFAYADLSEFGFSNNEVSDSWELYTAQANDDYFGGIAPAPPVPGSAAEDNVFVVVWERTIISDLTNNATITVPLTVRNEEGGNSLWEQTREIDVIVDKNNPSVTIGDPVPTETGYDLGEDTDYTVTLTTSDADSGIDFTTHSLICSDAGIILTKDSADIDSSVWSFHIPADYEIRTLTFDASIFDNVNNSDTDQKLWNVGPIPIISNVYITSPDNINPDVYFVPGQDSLIVSFDLTDSERVDYLSVVLSGVTGIYEHSWTDADLDVTDTTISYTFYNVNAVDAAIVTATVTGYVTYASGNVDLIGNGEFDDIIADTQPVISDISLFMADGTEIDYLPETELIGNYVEVTVTSIDNNMDPNHTVSIVNSDFTFSAPVLQTYNNDGIFVYRFDISSYTTDETNFTDGYYIVEFEANATSIYGYEAVEKNREIIILQNVQNVMFGQSPVRYSGQDPDGWFAPEHDFFATYAVYSTLDLTAINIQADFDEITDNVPDIWEDPDALATTEYNISLNNAGVNVAVTIYEHVATWTRVPDVQSIWNAYSDGDAIPISYQYVNMFTNNIIDPIDVRTIQVDLEIPQYENTWEYALEDAAFDPTIDIFSFDNVPNYFVSQPVELVPDAPGSETAHFEGRLFLRVIAHDNQGNGVGVDTVIIPANLPADWSINEISAVENGFYQEYIYEVIPSNPLNVNNDDILEFNLGKAEDLVGHFNYDINDNSTSSYYEEEGPTIKFLFVDPDNEANVNLNIASSQLFKIETGAADFAAYTADESAPYIAANERVGIVVEIEEVISYETNVDYVEILSLDLEVLTDEIDNSVDNWISLTADPNKSYDYHLADPLFAADLADGVLARIKVKYDMNYRVHYNDATTDDYNDVYESDWLDDINNLPGIVDNIEPNFVVLNTTPDYTNDAIFVWSETLGLNSEGYVSPNDVNGVVKIYFQDVFNYSDETTVPEVEIIGLDEFVSAIQYSYDGTLNTGVIVPESKLEFLATDEITINGFTRNYTNVWVATLDSLEIQEPVINQTFANITVKLTDAVGNGPAEADRMVEVTGDGPIVPVIRTARIITDVNELNINIIDNDTPAYVQMYVDCQESAFIEDAWVTPISGFTFQDYTIESYDPAGGVIDQIQGVNAQWLVIIPFTATGLGNEAAFDLELHTQRYPFGGEPMFEDIEVVQIVVDDAAPIIENITYDFDGTNVTITADIHDNNAGVYTSMTRINLSGINGADSLYSVTINDTLNQWSLIYPADFNEGQPNIDGWVTLFAYDAIGNDFSIDYQVDVQPVITNVALYTETGTMIDVLPQTKDQDYYLEVSIDAKDIFDHLYNDDITLIADLFTTAPARIDYNAVTGEYVYRYEIDPYDIDDSNFVDGYFVLDFTANVNSIYNFAATEYQRQVIILQNTISVMYGFNPVRYSGQDPDGWFAPEHDIHAEYTVFSDLADINIQANFDLITDVIPDEWIAPATLTSSDSLVTIVINGVNVDITLYEHIAIWEETPDVQSVWNAYDDGEAILVQYRYLDMFTAVMIEDNSRSIKVDLEVPQYNGEYYIAHEDSTFDITVDIPNYEYIGSLSTEATLPLVPNDITQQDEFVGKIYLKVPANDDPGVGIDAIETFTVADWTITFIDYEINGTVVSAIWELIPNIELNNDDVLSFNLPKVEDLVGHYNYGGEGYNSTSEHYEADGPVISIRFISDYSELDELYIYDYNNGIGTAPYIKAGQRVGINLTLKPVEQGGRAVTVTSIDVDAVFVNTDEIDGVADDSWYQLVANNGSYSLQDNIVADANLVDGEELRIKYKVVYLITYSDGSTANDEYVSDWVESYKAIVDNADPIFTINGIEIWSESLGYMEEGYVVPGNTEGEIKITFTDVFAYNDSLTKPMVEIDGFDTLIDGAFANPYVVLDEDITFDGTYWVAHLDSLHIDQNLSLDSSLTLEVTLTDAVGNDQTADRMVEIVDDQYLMPLIVDMNVISINHHANVPDFYIAEDSPIEITVDVQAAVEDYIEELRLDLSGLGVVGDVFIDEFTQTSVTPPIFTGTYILTNPITSADEVVVTAYTKRQPYGQTDVFTDEYEVTVYVDHINIESTEQTFVSTNLNEVEWTLNPDGTATATAVFGSIFGAHPEWNMDLTTIHNWFELRNTVTGNALLDNPKFANIVEEHSSNLDTIADTVLVTWNITADEVNDQLVIDVDGTESTLQFIYHARNIYGEEFAWTSAEVTVDDATPVFNNAFTYGENHIDNKTVVIGQDNNVKLFLEYTDISEVASIEADWSRFGGNVITFEPDNAKSEDTFTMLLTDIGVIPAVSVHDSLIIIITDNVGNVTTVNNLIPTTFVVDEDDTYALALYDNTEFEMFNANWYTKDANLELYAEHTVMGYDGINNDNDANLDEFGEGLLPETTAVVYINHNNNPWDVFAHETNVVNDTTFISLDDPYANFTEGKYNVQVDMENIFNQLLSNSVEFYVDQTPPVVNGIQFEGNATEFTMIDNITSYSDWTYINIKLADPDIIYDRASVSGSGVNDVNCSLELHDTDDNVIATFDTGNLVGDLIQFTATAGFSANDLVAGTYKFNITLEDNIGNLVTYEKAFYYNFEPPTFTVRLYDGSTEITNNQVNISIEDVFIHVTDINDIGTVSLVEFSLFNEENVQINHITEVTDDTVPYETMWDMKFTGIDDYMNFYNVPEVPEYRDWTLVTKVISNSGAEAIDTLSVQVIDDLGPKPTLIASASDFANGDILTYDFDNPVNNTSTIVAYCKYDNDGDDIVDETDPNYPDAWKVDFTITNSIGVVVATIPNTYMEVGTDNYIAEWNWSELARLYPGEYTIYATGWDRVDNNVDSESWTITLRSTGSAWADLSMHNFIYPNGGNNEETLIANNTIYSPAYSLDDNLANLRLDVIIENVDEVQTLGFFYEKVNVITGDTLVVATVLNDTAINPDMPEDVSNITTNQFIINGNQGTVSVVVQRGIYQPVDFDGNDFKYRFYAVIKDFTGEELLIAGHEADREKNIRVDYAAPVATISVNSLDLPFYGERIENEIALLLSANNENPADEIGTGNYVTLVQWRCNDTDVWHVADIDAAAVGVDDYNYTFSNWNTNPIDSLEYNLQGTVQAQVIISDERNNEAVTNIIDVGIDNQSPIAPVSAIQYVNPELGQIYEPAVNDTVVYQIENNSLITVKVYRDDITYLIDGFYPAVGQDDDLAMPIKLFDTDTGQIVAFDHMLDTDANGDYYEFEYIFNIPVNTTENRNFAVVAHDIRNNEEDFTIDLKLQIVDTTIVTEILGYDEGAINTDNIAVGGLMDLPATMAGTTDGIAILQYSINDGNVWTDIASVSYSDTVNVDFRLSDDDSALIWAMGIDSNPAQDEEDYLTSIPGVHIVNSDTGVEIVELVNDNGVWMGSKAFDLASVIASETVNYVYVIDANNNGVVVGDEYGNAIYEFKPESVILTHYFYQLDTTGMNGYYTFRATNADADEYDIINTYLIPVDNTALVLIPGIDIQGYEANVIAQGDQLTLINNIDNIGAVDGIVDVYYQYLAYDPAIDDSIWVNIGTQTDIGADYAQNYIAPDPEIDGWDNDFDDEIDEADEANSDYYFRTFAVDAAGNMSDYSHTSILVDASEAVMLIDTVAGVEITDIQSETIILIPEDGLVGITAIDITNIDGFVPPFDEAVTATYQWSRLLDTGWSNWENIAVGVPAADPVTWTLADPETAEDSYQLKVIAYDRFGQAEERTVAIMLNDENIPSANITAIGNATVVGDFAFVNSANIVNPVMITAEYPDTDNVVTLRFDYSEDGINWIYIATHDLTRGLANQAWEIPNPVAGQQYYVRVVAEDEFGNDSAPEIVQYFIDDSAPTNLDLVVNLDSHYNDGLNAMVAAIDDSLSFDVIYPVAGDAVHGIGDIASINLTLDGININENYTALGTANTLLGYIYNPVLIDGVYPLDVTLTDFAGNVATYTIYDGIIFDTTAPIVSNFHEINNLTEAVYNDTITFEFNYTDLIGVDSVDDMIAYFEYQGVIDSVQAYSLIVPDSTGIGTIQFDWIPSSAMQEFILANGEHIDVAISFNLEDKLGNINGIPHNGGTFRIGYGIPALARTMIIKDFVSGNDLLHYIDWSNNDLGEFVLDGDIVGGENITLYSYIPHLGEEPNSVTMEYKAPDGQTWVDLGQTTVSNSWQFIDPNFNNYLREYNLIWNIGALEAGGTYQVKTISHYDNIGTSETLIEFDIYKGMIVPTTVIVTDSTNTNGEYVLERGESYDFNTTYDAEDLPFIEEMKYKYRYVSYNGVEYIPISGWTHFGDEYGVEINSWTSADSIYSLTVYPYYLIDYKMQIVTITKDIYGTELAIANASSVYSQIQDTKGPILTGNGITITPLGGYGNGYYNGALDVKVELTDSSGIAHIELWLGDNQLAEWSVDGVNTVWNKTITVNNVDLSEYTSGTYQLQIIASDNYDNMDIIPDEAINIDNDVPEANMVVEIEGIEVASLERGTDVVLNSNAVDVLSEVETVRFAYRMAVEEDEPVNAWIAIIDTALVDPFTTQEWTVPANLEFGAYYEFQAVVTDSVGLVSEPISIAYQATDIDTDITIASVAGFVPPAVGPNGELYPITTRLHGIIDVVANVNVDDQVMPRLKYWYKENIETAVWTELGLSEDDASGYTFAFDTENEHLGFATDVNYQEYFIGVAPNERNAGEIRDSVLVMIDNFHDINVTTVVDPAINSELEVTFEVLSDDEIGATVTLDYATFINPADWASINAHTVTRLDETHYNAEFNLAGFNDYYNFKLIVEDRAFPLTNTDEHEFATNIMVDTIDPEVAITEVNGETDLTELTVELGDPVDILATAYDLLGGQDVQIASGVERVEFYYDGNFISEDMEEPYETTLNTIGFMIDLYELQAIVYDNAGNEGFSSIIDINIVPPSNLQPYAVISGFRFDEENCNEDYVYAVAEQWCNELIQSIRFEHSVDGVVWNEFGIDANDGDEYYEIQFNAEVMNDITKLRTVAVINDVDSSVMPELGVTYSTEQGGSFIPVASTMTSEIYNDDKLVISGTNFMPYVNQLLDNVYQTVLPVDMNGSIYEADINVNATGEYRYWIATWDRENDIQMISKDIEVYEHNAQIEGIAVESNLNIYFPAIYTEEEALMNSYLFNNDYSALAPFFAVNSTVAGAADISIDVPDDLDLDLGPIYVAIWDGDEWMYSVEDYDATANTVSFNAQLGDVYTVVQYGELTVVVEFDSITPSFIVDTTEWTTEDPEISFFVYDDIIEDGGYQSPQLAEIDIQMFVDDLEVVPAYNDGFITYSAVDLEEGEHLVEVLVTKDGFTDTADHSFFVDVTAPVITAEGTQLNETNLVISANIEDLETGLGLVNLFIAPVGGSTPIDIDFDLSTQPEFTHTLTINDIYGLIGYSSGIVELPVVWTAANNLGMDDSANIYYTINLTGPTINFIENEVAGWWLNPQNNPDITFEVSVAEGTIMPNDGVSVNIYEVLYSGMDQLIQSMIPVGTFNDTLYTYTVGFGQQLSPSAAGVRIEVIATNNYGTMNISEQTYNIDYAAPIMWALSPVGDAIDNDGDGLFNEDPINGVNDDQDWEDWNNNGIWDVAGWLDVNGNGVWDWIDYNGNGIHDCNEPMEAITAGEPGIVDEDVRDFRPDSLQYGTEITIALAYEDIVGQIEIDGSWYYSGASGTNETSLFVALNGEEISGVSVNKGMFSYAAGVLDPGHYIVTASIEDNVGNAGSLAYEFEIIGPAPSVTFIEPAAGWWLNPNSSNELQFQVNIENGGEVAEDGVVANIYSVFAGTLIQGPMTLNEVSGIYSAFINVGIIPSSEEGIRLEVITTNIWDNSSTSNQTYGIDNDAPIIEFVSPEDGDMFVINDFVNIIASFTDTQDDNVRLSKNRKNHSNDRMTSSQMKSSRRKDIDSASMKTTSKMRSFGSGIKEATLKVYSPDSEEAIADTMCLGGNYLDTRVKLLAEGNYDVILTVTDNVGNTAVSNLHFSAVQFVEPAPAILITGGENTYIYDESFSFAAQISAEGNSLVDISSIRVNVYGLTEESEVIPYQSNINVSLDVTEDSEDVTISTQIAPPGTSEFVGMRVEVIASSVNGEAALISQDYTADFTTFKFAVRDAHIYPNPIGKDVRGMATFVVDVNRSAELEIAIYDFRGKRVGKIRSQALRAGRNELSWDSKSIARGVYFAKVVANDRSNKVEKIIKVIVE